MKKIHQLFLASVCIICLFMAFDSVSVSAGTAACSFNSTDYTSLNAAFAAAGSFEGSELPDIVLGDDVMPESTIEVSGGTESAPVTLDLNGHKIDGKKVSIVIKVTEGSYFKLKDSDSEKKGEITQDDSSQSCLASKCGILNYGTFTMDGGKLVKCGNINNSLYNESIMLGGGVTNYGDFTFSGGSISSCQSVNGGGVANFKNFKMSSESCSISDCQASGNGGGVCNVNGGSDVEVVFDFSAGSIQGCKALGQIQDGNQTGGLGGGIYNSNAELKYTTVNMSGGTIKNCVAAAEGGGVYSYGNNSYTGSYESEVLYFSKLFLSGGAVIKDNTVNGSLNNVYSVSDCGYDNLVFDSAFSGNVGVHVDWLSIYFTPIGRWNSEMGGTYSITGTIFCDTDDTIAGRHGDSLIWTNCVAEYNGNKYSDLQTAITAGKKVSYEWSDPYIKLLNDVETSEIITVSDGVVKLDLNGHTITGNHYGTVFSVKRTNDYTTLEIIDSSEAHTGTITRNQSISENNRFRAITVIYANLIMNGGTIKNCGNNSCDGGAIYADTFSTVNIQNVTIDNCKANKGGAIYINKSEIELGSDTIIKNCKAVGYSEDYGLGGAVYIDIYGWGKAVFSVSSIENCEADYGGGIYCHINNSIGELKCNGTVIKSCKANHSGGGIYLYDAKATLSKADMKGSITKCTAGFQGGAVCLDMDGWDSNNKLTLSDFEIKENSITTANNQAGVYGGGIFTKGKVVLQENTQVIGNTAPKGEGGASIADNIAYDYSVVGGQIIVEEGFKGAVGVSLKTMPDGEDYILGAADSDNSDYSKSYRIYVDGTHFVGIAKTSSTDIYLKTEYDRYSVRFNNYHGSTPESQKVKYGQKVVKPVDPTAEGYYFEGWFKDEAFTEVWDFNTDIVEKETILYAKWSELINVPTGVEELVYNGSQQTGVNASDQYTLGGTIAAINSGSYQATATPKAGYRWMDKSNTSKTVNWSIAKRSLNDVTIDTIPDQTYSGTEIKPDVTLFFNGSKLNKDTDYTVSYDDNTELGTATVSVTGNGNFKDTVSKNFGITMMVYLPLGKSLTYTGEEQTGVSEGAGYTLSGGYSATDAGSYNATVTLKQADGYFWEDASTDTERTVTWTIKAQDLSTANVDDVTDKAKTGSPITPEPEVTLNGTKLTKDVDFEYSYENNTSVGIASIKITGINNYMGEINKTFTIILPTYTFSFNSNSHGNSPASQDILEGSKASSQTISASGYYFEGWYKEAECVNIWDFDNDIVTGDTTVYAKWSTLIEIPAGVTGLTYNATEQTGVSDGTGYSLTGKTSAVDSGAYTASATLKAGYRWSDNSTDIKTINWTINPRDIKEVSINEISEQTLTDKAVEPDVSVTFNGIALVKDVDFTCSYKDNAAAGTGTIKISGIGNYTGDINKTFTIVKPEPVKPEPVKPEPVKPEPANPVIENIPDYPSATTNTNDSTDKDDSTKDDTDKDNSGKDDNAKDDNAKDDNDKKDVTLEQLAKEQAKKSPNTVFEVTDPETGKKVKFYADKNGKIVKNKVITLSDGSKVYATKTGALAKKCFITTKSGRTYYVGKNGKIVKNKIFKINGKKYYAGKTGAIKKNALFKDTKGRKHYCTEDGSFAMKQWITYKNKKYWCSRYGNITKSK